MVAVGWGVVVGHMLEGREEVPLPLLLAPRHLPDHDYRIWLYPVKEFSEVCVRKP